MYQIKDHNIYLISDNSTLTTTLIIFIKNIFHYQSHAFNLNRTFSFILQHHETLEYCHISMQVIMNNYLNLNNTSGNVHPLKLFNLLEHS